MSSVCRLFSLSVRIVSVHSPACMICAALDRPQSRTSDLTLRMRNAQPC